MPSGFNYSNLQQESKFVTILDLTTITTAVTGTTPGYGGANGINSGIGGANYVVWRSTFDYGADGTTAKLWLQTSLDGGTTWIDIANHAYTTADAVKVSALTTGIAPASQGFAPADGALADGTVVNGVLGDRFRVKLTTTGTYSGSTTIKSTLLIKS